MNDLKVTGKQNFMGLDIPVVLGGFGEGKKCISDKTIAEIHNQPVYEIRRRIGDNIRRFKESIDYIDMKQRMGESQTSESERAYQTSTLEFLSSLGYAKQSITQAEHIYTLSERGYAKLIKIMDTDLAWEVHDKLMDEYFELREIPKLSSSEIMRIQLGMIDDHEDRIGKLESSMGISHSQAKVLSDLARDKTLDLIGGKNSRAYTYQYPSKGPNDKPQSLYKKLVRRLWCDYWDYFKITSRDNTPVLRFEEAKNFIRDWEPSMNLRMDIEKVNSEDFDGYLEQETGAMAVAFG